MKKYIILALLCFSALPALACITCNKEIREGIWNSSFYPNLLTMLSGFIVLAIIVIILSAVASKRHIKRRDNNQGIDYPSPVPLTTASMVLGIGLGGFADGIILHQLLQWHEMLSNKIPATNYVGKSINMFWDGVFHFFCLAVVVTGVILLWRLMKRKDVHHSGKLLSGGLLLGWGVFNIVEGIIDHHLLKLHNILELSPNHDTGNFIFLGISVLLILSGYALVKSVNKKEHRPNHQQIT